MMLVFGMILMRMANSVSNFVNVRCLIDKAVIDNLIFRAHYRLTSLIFLVFCILVKLNILFDPISCITDSDLSKLEVNTYCWITRTYKILGLKSNNDVYGERLGIGYNPDQPRHHAYYQWVPFMLFFQGLLFCIPHWIWKNWEEGKIGMLTDGLRGSVVNEERKDRQNRLVQYLFETLQTNNIYAFGYFFCEALNFINVILNMWIIDKFLGNTFTTYGTDVLKFVDTEQSNRTDPMIEVFPRLIICTFHKFGASGTIQRHDSTCILKLNVLNEKIYIFLWFWLIMLGVLSAITLLYSLVVLTEPSVRRMILVGRFRLSKSSNVLALVKKIQIGDFLLLHFLGQNVNVVNFREILQELSDRLHIDKNISPATSTIELSNIYRPSYAT